VLLRRRDEQFLMLGIALNQALIRRVKLAPDNRPPCDCYRDLFRQMPLDKVAGYSGDAYFHSAMIFHFARIYNKDNARVLSLRILTGLREIGCGT
jgi:hypothetical protein